MLKEFKGQTLKIDGKSFQDARFDSCTLIYSGGLFPTFKRCKFIAPKFVFDGPAANALRLMASLYADGAGTIIENTFDEIRGGRQTGITIH